MLTLASVVQMAVASTQHKDNVRHFRDLCDQLGKLASDYGEHR